MSAEGTSVPRAARERRSRSTTYSSTTAGSPGSRPGACPPRRSPAGAAPSRRPP